MGRGRHTRGVWIWALLGACNAIQIRPFFGAGSGFERAFGQLYDDAGTPKVSHYAVLSIGAAEVATPTSGTVEYVRNFDGMGHCLLLRSKKFFTTPNDVSRLEQLPKPGALVVGLCNLDEPTVDTAVRALYTARLSAGEAPAATTKFLAGDEDFRRIDVTAHATDPNQSTKLGKPLGGKLRVAAFTESDDGSPRRYVNPLPYLAGALPAAALDAVGPQIDEVKLETSAAGDFGADRVTHTPAADVIPGDVPRTWLRVAVKVTDRFTSGGPVVTPYRVRYELSRLTLSGAAVSGREVKARGRALMNHMTLADAATLANRFGATPGIASNPATGEYWVMVPFDPAGAMGPAAVEGTPPPYNGLDPLGPMRLDLAEAPGGAPRFPSGPYELVVAVEDGVNAPTAAAEKKFRLTLGAGAPPPGDSTLSFLPTSGPLTTEVVITSAVTGAFAADTTVSFTGRFDPDGVSTTGTDLGASAPFTIEYPATKVRLIDAEHVGIRVGAVVPSVAVLDSAELRYSRGGELRGQLRVRTPSTTFDHTITGDVAFRITEAVRFGQVVAGELKPLASLPIVHAGSAAEVAATPDFQRISAEWRGRPVGAAPATIQVRVRTVAPNGSFDDDQPHEMGLAGEVDGVAIYRSGAGGTRKLVLVSTSAFSGPQGADVLAVHIDAGGVVRLDGAPPP